MTTTIRRQRGSAGQERLIANLRSERLYDYAVDANATTTRGLIDYLLSCPVRAERARPLSQAQAAMIRRVAQELGRDVEATLTEMLTAPDRRAAVDGLLADARADRTRRNSEADQIMRAAAGDLPVNHGYVLADGSYVRTYRGQDGSAKVKILNRETGAWEYLSRGLVAIARPTTRPITVEDAREIARLSRTCGHCGRAIETAESIERGIGPVCAKKF